MVYVWNTVVLCVDNTAAWYTKNTKSYNLFKYNKLTNCLKKEKYKTEGLAIFKSDSLSVDRESWMIKAYI